MFLLYLISILESLISTQNKATDVCIALQIIFQSNSKIVSYFVLVGCNGIRKHKIRVRAVKKTTVQ